MLLTIIFYVSNKTTTKYIKLTDITSEAIGCAGGESLLAKKQRQDK